MGASSDVCSTSSWWAPMAVHISGLFLVFLGQLHAKEGVRQFGFLVGHLAYVVEQACAACLLGVETEFPMPLRRRGWLFRASAAAGSGRSSRRYFILPTMRMSSGCRPCMPRSMAVRWPVSIISCSSCLRTFATSSSMRAGCMRPSAYELMGARRAISRRTGSKPDSTIASGYRPQ